MHEPSLEDVVVLDEMSLEELLALMYETAPQDVPEIKYEVGGLKKPLAELSVGQKAAALLIVGLSDGRFPIIIDQPEDSLDLRSIWSDVCQTLRDSKDHRQFIFTTHNSSVAVASDSDKFTILEAGATQATVLHSGSINSEAVRKQVIAYLEGGPDTYEKKRAKYNLDHLKPTGDGGF
jgi:ABC-type multidrug transport system ATPase subunit